MIKGYTTSVAASKTVTEVTDLLARKGVNRISTSLVDGRPAGVVFEVETEYGPREFALPVRVDAVQTAIAAAVKVNGVGSFKGGKVALLSREQAERVAWRIAHAWLDAQLALIEAGLTSIDEVMLPFMVEPSGRTFYEAVRERGLAELEATK